MNNYQWCLELIKCLSIFDHELSDIDDSVKTLGMQFSTVSKSLGKNFEMTNTMVHGFVTSHQSLLVKPRFRVAARCDKPRTSISTVSNRLFTKINAKYIFLFRYLQVWICSTGITSMRPHNVAIMNIQTYLISNPWTMELVRIPFPIEICRLLNSEICPIQRNKRNIAVISTDKSVLKVNL